MAKCRGKCKGDRSNLESPAVMLRHGKRRLPACTCCQDLLQFQPGAQGAPAIRKDIQAEHIRFQCPNCEYDVVVLKELKPV